MIKNQSVITFKMVIKSRINYAKKEKVDFEVSLVGQ